MRDFDVSSISVNDVLHTLRELNRDGKYEGMFDQFLTFASELTGISEDALAEKLYEGRQNNDRMEIDDSYDLNDGGKIFSVKLAENRFVDVKACGNGGPVYVMENEDGSTVYTGEWKADGTCPGYEYDEKAVLDFVKGYMKEQEKDKGMEPELDGEFENNRDAEEDYVVRDLGNGYQICKVFANQLPDGCYGDIYDSPTEVEREHPGAEVMVGYCVVDTGIGLVPDWCNDWNDTISDAEEDYRDNVMPYLDSMDMPTVESWKDMQEKYPMGREDMSIEEEEQFVEDCYKLYEKEGFSPRYWSPFTDNQERVGKSVEIIGRIEADGVHDLSCLPMWKAKLDGEEFEVFPEEVVPSEMRANGCRWFDQPSLEDKIGEAEELKGNHNIEDKERAPIER